MTPNLTVGTAGGAVSSRQTGLWVTAHAIINTMMMTQTATSTTHHHWKPGSGSGSGSTIGGGAGSGISTGCMLSAHRMQISAMGEFGSPQCGHSSDAVAARPTVPGSRRRDAPVS